MRLESGTTLAQYEIVAALGKGGMGEVYRARDRKLGREVAIKILPDELTADSEQLARLEREARILASLSHPNVAGIFEIGSAGSDSPHLATRLAPLHYLVMELAGGEDLADRLARGPIPIDEAIQIAKQIAEALEAAHGLGIVHRDLKPANVRVDEQLNVKVLDFGLARQETIEPADQLGSEAPTLVRGMTREGTILGTVAYMSPEQARGKRVDKQTDIWAFGVVLWEMLTGESLFSRPTVSDTLAAILKEEPSWGLLPAPTPPVVRRLLRLCLQKKTNDRLHDIGDARLELEYPVPTGGEPSGRPRQAWLAAGIASLVAIVAVAAITVTWNVTVRQRPPAIHLRLPLEPVERLWAGASVAVSPDGKTIIFQGMQGSTSRLFARRITGTETTIVPGSDGGNYPAFSPDGRSIVFAARGYLWRSSLQGGEPLKLTATAVSGLAGICWSPGGQIIFAGPAGLRRAPDRGGDSVGIVTPPSDTWFSQPRCLSDGRHVLIGVLKTKGEGTTSISSLDLESGESRDVVRDGLAPKIGPVGHLLFLRGSSLMAVRFDDQRLTTSGDPVEVVARVSHDRTTLNAGYDVSPAGTLAYVPAQEVRQPRGLWIDQSGAEVGQVDLHLDGWTDPKLSPDGSKLLVTEIGGPVQHVWIFDLEAGARTKLTTSGDNGQAIWMPDGRHVVYASSREGQYQIVQSAADGTERPETLVRSSRGWILPLDVSRDGRFLLYCDRPSEDAPLALWYQEIGPGASARRLLQTSGDERNAAFSPDGRYVAYEATAPGMREVFVTPFPGPGASWQISSGGGRCPVWSRDGRYLFYHAKGSVRGSLVRVETTTRPTFRAGRHTALIPLRFAVLAGRNFDVSPDGSRFLFVEAQNAAPYEHLDIVLNWSEELRRILAAR